MKAALQLSMSHQLKMTPHLQRAISLLQLSTIELQSVIQSALDTNVLLELSNSYSDEMQDNQEQDHEEQDHQEQDPQDPQDPPEQDNQPQEEQEYNPGDDFRNSLSRAPNAGDPLQLLNAKTDTLQDYLTWQMELTPFGEVDQSIAATLIDSINESGFLKASLEEIALTVRHTNKFSQAISISEIETVLHRIQQFDPVGVGSRSLSECLGIQLKALTKTPWRDKALELVNRHMALLAKRDYASLRRRLNINAQELKSVILGIQSLNPRPNVDRSTGASNHVIPDMTVFKKHGVWQVELNPDCTSLLQINQRYADLIKENCKNKDNLFLKNQLQEAKWFIKSIETRNQTLLAVGRFLVTYQHAFFERGDEAMKPLILNDIAKTLKLHESTISRITTQKYLQSVRGTFELKHFFSAYVSTEQGECSAMAIRARLKKWVAQEDPVHPLSDNKLCEKLAEHGITVARRTIAKYREEMAIPPSHERKIFLHNNP